MLVGIEKSQGDTLETGSVIRIKTLGCRHRHHCFIKSKRIHFLPFDMSVHDMSSEGKARGVAVLDVETRKP